MSREVLGSIFGGGIGLAYGAVMPTSWAFALAAMLLLAYAYYDVYGGDWS